MSSSDNEKNSLVCTNNDRQHITFNIIEIAVKSEGLNAHSFRHSHATLLIENDATPKSVSGRLGHSDVIITQNLYTHVTEKMNEETVAIFSKMMQTKCKHPKRESLYVSFFVRFDYAKFKEKFSEDWKWSILLVRDRATRDF